MRILGIDPGSIVTGFGVVDSDRRRVVHVAHGTLRPPRGEALHRRLHFIHRRLLEVVEQHRPDLAVVECVFLASNPRSALVLGQARGAALAALAASGLDVEELAAREVKKALVGTGSAAKSQVAAMVQRLLCLESKPPSDAADALAVAICQAHRGVLAGVGVTGGRRRRTVASATAHLVERLS